MDLTKILKNAPKGFKLYSTIHGEVKFERIDSEEGYPIITSKVMNPDTLSFSAQSFTKEGEFYLYEHGECILFPSKDQRDWNKFTAPWYKQDKKDVKEKFDPKTLKVLDKVLVKDILPHHWNIGIFSHYIEGDTFPYKCVGNNYILCIPYNDDTKHLVGTIEEAPEYYRYWEE